LIGAVEDLTGLTINHYAEINLLGFYNLTKAIGGVDVCLAAAVNDPLSGAHLPAGPQTISGADALAFVRQRHGLPQGDLSRVRRQQVFLAAVAKKVLAGSASGIPALVGVAEQSLVIDSGWDLVAFAQQAFAIAAGNLQFRTIPTEGATTNERGDVVLVDRFDVRDFVQRRINAQGAKPLPPQLPDDVIASRYVIDVRNASSAPGMAAAVANHLGTLGFGRGAVRNAPATGESVVRYTGSDGAAARAVAAQLGGIATESDGDVLPGYLTVVIGSDFDPSAIAPTPTPPPTPPPTPITAAGVPCID
jgi:hypothetical protein